jgi:hypothetical protein
MFTLIVGLEKGWGSTYRGGNDDNNGVLIEKHLRMLKD